MRPTESRATLLCASNSPQRCRASPAPRRDAPAIRAYRNLPDVARFQSWDSFSASDAEELIAGQAAVVPDTPGTWLQLAIVAVESGAMIGDCGIHFLGDDLRQVELGITLAPTYHRRGLAAEALSVVLEYVFGRLGKHRVFAVTDAENQAAVKLMERVGFRQEAHYVENVWFKGAWGSEYLFAMLGREWQVGHSLVSGARRSI